MSTANIRQSKAKSKRKTRSAGHASSFEPARKRLDKKRIARERDMHWAHFWNLCPKCGGDMFEQKVLGIYFDVCRKCHGIYIDASELRLASKHLSVPKFLSALLKRAKKPIVKT